jgi:hypothetical protein
MKKINGFTITKLTLSGFKCYEDTTTFDFGDTTYITAGNGQGKSSIADAIAFAFVGTPFFGDRGLDRLQNKNRQEMTVSVDFIDDTGETHNLTRTRKRDATTIAFDGINARQTDLNTAFGDRDEFLAILNPLYFINVLGDSGKSLLEKLLPVVRHQEVLAALPLSSQEVLASQKILMPETFIKSYRSELKKLEETLIGYRSQKELLDCQQEERTANINGLRAAIGEISDEMTVLTDIRDNDRDLTTDESILAELGKRRDELLSDITQSGVDKATQGIMAEIRVVEASIAQQSVLLYQSPYAVQIVEAEAGLKVLYDEHARLSKALTDTVVGYKCPTCAVIITKENISAVKADLQRRLSTLVDDGKSVKNTLVSIKAQDSKAHHAFDSQKTARLVSERNKLAELNQQLQEMNVARELDAEDYGTQLADMDRQISEQAHKVANGNLTPEQVLRYAELEQTLKECEAKVEALEGIVSYDYTVLMAETEAEINRIKRLISEAIQYMAKRIELMLDGLKMYNTEVVLTEMVKTTGEIKDCFRFSYDGRDYRCLSLSEKVRAGLDISTLIQRLSGRNYPIFVDNGESICTFGKVQLPGQVIIARVVNNQALQVTYRNREQSKMVA